MATGLADKQIHGTIEEYLEAMRASERFGPQVVHVRRLEASAALYANPAKPWSAKMRPLVDGLGLDGLYSHQVEALNLVRSGESVIVATPTASGKSLIYNMPVFEHLLNNPTHHALYLFPLKALAQDQLKAIEKMIALLPENSIEAAIYDGDTSAYKRKKIREMPPQVLIANPDILHLSLMGYHQQWGGFWGRLSHIVLDEVHTYRGVFGSHLSWVLRRLRRICRLYGSDPLFVMSSATVGNPEQLAADLLGDSVTAVLKSGAPQGVRNFVFFDPYDSPAYAASQLLEAALKRGLRTIVYTQSRKIAELVSLWTTARLGDIRHKLTAYRAGFLPEERRQIEARLSSGDLLGVVSTSALELGVDIGSLELCIMVGYPGSIMATWQRGGRVGRRHKPSLIVMIAQEDALDQHFMRNPDDFFDRPVEAAVLNPDNLVIVKQHLLCAAAEFVLAADDPLLTSHVAVQALQELSAEGKILQSADGSVWFSVRKNPHREVDLRGSGQNYAIYSSAKNSLLGEIGGGRVFKECHAGAVYLQRGQTYIVDELDIDRSLVKVSARKVHFFTRALSDKTTEILETFDSKKVLGISVSIGRLRVTEQVTEYQRRLVRGQKLIGTHKLDLPPDIFETEGLWLHIPDVLQGLVRKKRMDFMGGIHALEHAAIGMFPLLVLCDRSDVGGLSTPFHHQTGGAVVFVYDGYSGGIGLCRQAYEQVEDLLRQSLKAITSCACETGCPSCVHSPKCGNGNRPIDKGAAEILLAGMLEPAPGWQAKVKKPRRKRMSVVKEFEKLHLPDHYAVFDLETQRSAAEVGGWHRAEKMGISTAVLYDSLLDDYLVFMEDEVEALVEHLKKVELVVGFNNLRFDNLVLSAYTSYPLASLPALDILQIVCQRLNYRLSLDRLAEHTLGVSKSANGLLALKWYKQGEMQKIVEYCRQDVKITRDLLLFGIRNGYLLFKNKAGDVVRCPFF